MRASGVLRNETRPFLSLYTRLRSTRALTLLPKAWDDWYVLRAGVLRILYGVDMLRMRGDEVEAMDLAWVDSGMTRSVYIEPS